MRVFLDTSVLVAAFATRGLCADVLRTVLAEHELVIGETVLTELARALTEKLGMAGARAEDVVAFVRQQGTVAAETPDSTIDVRDPNAVPILAAAIAGGADVLVTGDEDLLVLQRVGRIPIVDPRGFWRLAKAKPGA